MVKNKGCHLSSGSQKYVQPQTVLPASVLPSDPLSTSQLKRSSENTIPPAPPPPSSEPQWLPFAHTHYGGPSCQRPLQTSLSPLPLTLGKLRDTEHFDSHELYMWLSEFKLIKNELHYREFPGSLVVRTLCCHCHGLGSIPGWGTKIPQATWHSASPPPPIQKKKKNLKKVNYIIVKNSAPWSLSHFKCYCG